MRISKMWLKLSFSHHKWVLQAILPLTVVSNCISLSSKLNTALPLTVLNFEVFFQVIG